MLSFHAIFQVVALKSRDLRRRWYTRTAAKALSTQWECKNELHDHIFMDGVTLSCILLDMDIQDSYNSFSVNFY